MTDSTILIVLGALTVASIVITGILTARQLLGAASGQEEVRYESPRAEGPRHTTGPSPRLVDAADLDERLRSVLEEVLSGSGKSAVDQLQDYGDVREISPSFRQGGEPHLFSTGPNLPDDRDINLGADPPPARSMN